MGDEIKVVCVEVVAETRGGRHASDAVECYRARFVRGHDATDPAASFPQAAADVLTTQKGMYRVGETYTLKLAAAPRQ